MGSEGDVNAVLHLWDWVSQFFDTPLSHPQFACWMHEYRSPQLPDKRETVLPLFWPWPHSAYTWEPMEMASASTTVLGEHWHFKHSHSSASYILRSWLSTTTKNSFGLHRFLKIGLAGTWPRLCGTHTRSWGARAKASFMLTHHPYLPLPQFLWVQQNRVIEFFFWIVYKLVVVRLWKPWGSASIRPGERTAKLRQR